MKYKADVLNSKISSNSFIAKFLSMKQNDHKNYQILEKDLKRFSIFSIDSKSYGFGYLIEQIYDFSLLAEYSQILEDEFWNSVTKVFSEMKKYFNG